MKNFFLNNIKNKEQLIYSLKHNWNCNVGNWVNVGVCIFFLYLGNIIVKCVCSCSWLLLIGCSFGRVGRISVCCGYIMMMMMSVRFVVVVVVYPRRALVLPALPGLRPVGGDQLRLQAPRG